MLSAICNKYVLRWAVGFELTFYVPFDTKHVMTLFEANLGTWC